MEQGIIDKYLRNEKTLEHTFCFESLGTQLLLLSHCPEKFGFPIPSKIQRTATILYENLLKGYNNANLENSLVVIQSNILREEFLKLLNQRNIQ